MKISIVNPHIPVFQRDYAFRKTRRWQPLSTAIVAAWLERQGGWQIQFLDAHVMDWDAAEVVRRVRDFAPDVLFYSSERTDAWELPIPDLGYIEHFFAEARREHVRPRSILLEGPHGSIFPEDMLRRLPEVDACLRGETEPVSFAALSALAAGQGFAQVPSVTWREPGGRVVSNPEDPDPIKYRDFPSPAWHLLPMDRYRDAQAPHVPFAMLETSRGCPMPCGYCYKQMFRDRQSKRAPIQVLDEVQEVVAKYGVRRIMFQDQYFTLDRGHVAAICEGLIARALHRVIEWRCQTRLNGMKQGLLHLMRNAGCVEIYTGLETGSETLQRHISKLAIEEFLEYRRFGESIGLRISPNMILGLPGETYATAMQSLRFFHRLGVAMVPNVNITYPMTRYYAEAVARGELSGSGWDEVVAGAGLVGTALDRPAIDRIRRRARLLNRALRWKKRLWRLFGAEYGRAAARKLLRAREAAPERGAPVL